MFHKWQSNFEDKRFKVEVTGAENLPFNKSFTP